MDADSSKRFCLGMFPSPGLLRAAGLLATVITGCLDPSHRWRVDSETPLGIERAGSAVDGAETVSADGPVGPRGQEVVSAAHRDESEQERVERVGKRLSATRSARGTTFTFHVDPGDANQVSHDDQGRVHVSRGFLRFARNDLELAERMAKEMATHLAQQDAPRSFQSRSALPSTGPDDLAREHALDIKLDSVAFSPSDRDVDRRTARLLREAGWSPLE